MAKSIAVSDCGKIKKNNPTLNLIRLKVWLELKRKVWDTLCHRTDHLSTCYVHKKAHSFLFFNKIVKRNGRISYSMFYENNSGQEFLNATWCFGFARSSSTRGKNSRVCFKNPTHRVSLVQLCYKHVPECIKKWQAVCSEVLLCCFYLNLFFLLFCKSMFCFVSVFLFFLCSLIA